jgi:hypothetical protein
MMLRNTFAAAGAYRDYFARTQALVPAAVAAATDQTLDTMRATLLDRLQPAVTVPARISNRLHTVEGTPVTAEEATDPFAPMPHP